VGSRWFRLAAKVFTKCCARRHAGCASFTALFLLRTPGDSFGLLLIFLLLSQVRLIPLAQLRIGQRGVRLGGFFGSFLCLLIPWVSIRVICRNDVLLGLVKFLVGGARRYAKYLVRASSHVRSPLGGAGAPESGHSPESGVRWSSKQEYSHMSTAPGEQPIQDSELLPPGHDIITEANWEELKAREGFQMLLQQVDLDTSEGQGLLKLWQDKYGREYVYVGSAFESDERRPLDHKPGKGIYVNREGQYRASEGNGYVAEVDGHFVHHPQPPDDGGPASS
jgi:hypothetical protein